MSFFGNLSKKQKPVAPPGAVVDNSMGQRPMRQQPRPSLIVGGPAYFTPEGYEAPRQPEQAFMPTDTRPDPIGEQFRRERPTLPPMPPAITGTDLGLPMNPGIPAPGGVEMGQPFQLPGRSPTGDTSFLDFFNQQMGNGNLTTAVPQPSTGGGLFGNLGTSGIPLRTPGQYSVDPREGATSFDPVTALGATPETISGGGGGFGYNPETGFTGYEGGPSGVNFDPLDAITTSGWRPGDPLPPKTPMQDDPSAPPYDPPAETQTATQDDIDIFQSIFATRPGYRGLGHGMSPMEEQEAFASGQDVVYTNTEGPAQRFRGLPTQAEMEQLNAGNKEWMAQYGSTPPRQIATPIPNASPVTSEQEVFINGLTPGSGGYLPVPAPEQVSMPLPMMPQPPMMPAPPAMMPASPPMMPSLSPNPNRRIMNPRFTR